MLNDDESDDIEKLCEEIDAHQREYDRRLKEEDFEFQKDKTRALSQAERALQFSKRSGADRREAT
jgi:hypothetical protein